MQFTGLEIRKAGREDYDGVMALYQPTGRDSKANLERELADPNVDILVAVIGDRIIGSVIGTNDGRNGWVNRLAVDPDHRGEGIAKALVEGVEFCSRPVP